MPGTTPQADQGDSSDHQGFGFTNPILADETGEIIAGHGRFEAALSLGMSSVPVLRVLGLAAVQKRALRLADNKLALDSAWDVELLSSELADLTLTDFDITLTGFETIEVDRLTTPSLGLADEDDALPVKRPGIAGGILV